MPGKYPRKGKLVFRQRIPFKVLFLIINLGHTFLHTEEVSLLKLPYLGCSPPVFINHISSFPSQNFFFFWQNLRGFCNPLNCFFPNMLYICFEGSNQDHHFTPHNLKKKKQDQPNTLPCLRTQSFCHYNNFSLSASYVSFIKTYKTS